MVLVGPPAEQPPGVPVNAAHLQLQPQLGKGLGHLIPQLFGQLTGGPVHQH